LLRYVIRGTLERDNQAFLKILHHVRSLRRDLVICQDRNATRTCCKVGTVLKTLAAEIVDSHRRWVSYRACRPPFGRCYT